MRDINTAQPMGCHIDYHINAIRNMTTIDYHSLLANVTLIIAMQKGRRNDPVLAELTAMLRRWTAVM